MANVLYPDIAGDARAAESISGTFLELWGGPTALPKHPALVYGGSITGLNTKVITVPHMRTEGNAFATTAEGTDLTDSALTTGSSDVTVARAGISYMLGDLMRTTDRSKIYDAIAQGLFSGYTRALLLQIINIIDGFTLTQTATSTLTAEDFLAAKAKLGAVPGSRLAVLHSKSFGELERDIGLNAGGGHVFNPATQEMINKVGSGFVGSWAGVEIFVTDDVISSGGDRKNAILAPGAICWADGEPVSDGLPTQMMVGGKVLVDLERQGGKFQSRLIANGLLGSAMGIDARGVTLNSDA